MNHLTKEHIDLTIDSLAKNGSSTQLMELKNICEKKNFPFSTENYNNILSNVFLENSQKTGKQALQVYQEMKSKSVKPNQRSYEILLVGLSSCPGDYSREAFEIFNEMKSIGGKTSEQLFFQVLIPLAEKNQLKEAEQIAEMALENLSKSDVRVYNILIKLYLDQNKPEKLDQLLEQMEKNNVEKNSISWSLLIDAYKDNDEKMQYLVSQMEETKITFDVTIASSLMSFHASKGNYEKAEFFMERIVSSGKNPLVFAVNSLLQHYADKGDLRRAQKVFDFISSSYPSTSLDQYILLATACINAENFQKCDEIVETIEDLGFKCDSNYYRMLIKRRLYDYAFEVSDAEKILTLMKEKGVTPSYEIYSDLVDAYCAAGLMEDAQRMLEVVEAAGFYEPLDLYFAVITGYAKLGNMRDAAPLINYFSASKTKELVENYKTKLQKE